MTIIANVYSHQDWNHTRQGLLDDFRDYPGMSAKMQISPIEDLVLDMAGLEHDLITLDDNRGFRVTITNYFGFVSMGSGELHLVGSGKVFPNGGVTHLYGGASDASEGDPEYSGRIIRHSEDLPEHLR